KGNGKASPRTVEFVDLYPTLAELAKLKAPTKLEGASPKPRLDDPSEEWKRPAFTQVQRGAFPGYSVRTERWRYIEWDDGKQGAQLYDHDQDPHELNNLVNDAKYADVVAEMKQLVKQSWPVRVQGGVAANKKQKAK